MLRRALAHEMIDSLAEDVFQACVTLGTLGNKNFDEFPLRFEPLCAVWPRTNESPGGTIPLTELRGFPLVIPSADRADAALNRWLFDQFTASGFRPRIAAEACDASEAFNLVEDGLGVAILPRGLCQETPRDLRRSLITGIEGLQLILTCRRKIPHRVQKIVSEITNALRRADLAKVG